MTAGDDPAARKQALESLIQCGYLPVIEGLTKHFTAPLCWHGDSCPTRNGTMCFIQTGRRLIGVTAGHVYDCYLEAQSKHHDLTCQLGGTLFDPQSRLIDYDNKLDLATFEIDEQLLKQADREAVAHAPAVWPPALPQERDLIIVGGWPGSQRYDDGDTLDFSFEWFCTLLDVGRSDKLSISLKLDRAMSAVGMTPEELRNLDLGGFSGGPVLLLREEPLVTLTIVGFVYEGNGSFELLFARPALFVRDDGALDRTLL